MYMHTIAQQHLQCSTCQHMQTVTGSCCSQQQQLDRPGPHGAARTHRVHVYIRSTSTCEACSQHAGLVPHLVPTQQHLPQVVCCAALTGAAAQYASAAEAAAAAPNGMRAS